MAKQSSPLSIFESSAKIYPKRWNQHQLGSDFVWEQAYVGTRQSKTIS